MVPVVVIVFCYAGIIFTVSRSRQNILLSREGASKQKQELQIAKVVALNITLFVLSWLPYTIVSQFGISGYYQFVTPVYNATSGFARQSFRCVESYHIRVEPSEIPVGFETQVAVAVQMEQQIGENVGGDERFNAGI